jgi:hypothetical protein
VTPAAHGAPARLYFAREARHTEEAMKKAHDIARVIAALGGPADDPVVDFLVDPGAGCHAIDAIAERQGIVVRVAPDLTDSATASHGPVPRAHLWVRVMRGAREVGLASGGGDGWVRRAEHVAIEEHEESCCDAPACDRRRRHAAVWLVLEPIAEKDAPDRLLIAEQRLLVVGADEPQTALAVGARFAAALGVPLRRGRDDAVPAGGELPPALRPLVPADDLARFALRSEGERVVLRDWESAGPRASAARNAWIGASLLVAAAGAWYEVWRSIGADASGAAIAAGTAAALLTLAGYAFVGVARFSARYRAACAPLVAVGKDRIIVLPWVGRDGAVDKRPEGRLGAAIPLSEVRGAQAGPRANGFSVEVDTDHGRIDAMVCPSRPLAELWAMVLDRVVDEARHPRQGVTARQRARLAELQGKNPAE